MKSFHMGMPIVVAALLAACASPSGTPDAPAPKPSLAQIMEACMKVEVPTALKRLGLGPIRTREDAVNVSRYLCQIVVRTCAADPAGDDCQKELGKYGLGDPSYSPSPGASLYNAAENGATATVRSLLTAGADPNWRNAVGWTPLMIAAAEKHPDTVAALLEAKADPNARNSYGRTALMYASGYGQDTIVERLLAAGADPNIVPTDQSGCWTALIAAAAGGHAKTVEVLLRGGADPTIKSKDGKTAIEIARSAGHSEVVRILQAAAAGKP
jgi:ankyrin repeat protein